MNALVRGIAVAVGMILGSTIAVAQPGGEYDLSWYTVDGGGVTFLSGGGYILGGTAGQADAAGPRSANGYTLVSGFWAFVDVPAVPCLDPTDIDKCRFISFVVRSSADEPCPLLHSRGTDDPPVSPLGKGGGEVAVAEETALRVTLESLHHLDPPYTGAPGAAPFSACEGKTRWVGPPNVYIESQANPTRFVAAQTRTDAEGGPHYRDWSSFLSCSDDVPPFEYGIDFSPTLPLPVCESDADCPAGETCSVPVHALLHVTGSAIVPSSIYTVENVAASCAGSEATCPAVSAPLTVGTARWGDVVAAFQLTCPEINSADCNATTCSAISCTTQPDTSDFGSLVNKFKSQSGAPIKARGLLAGDAAGVIDLVPDLGFTHIAACVDAFKGKAYGYAPECVTNP